MRATGIAVLLLLTGAASPAMAFDLAGLMRLRAAAPSLEVSYVERKYSALLTEPVVSSGTLVYRRPGTVEKNMAIPRRESFHIAGSEVSVARDGKHRRVALAGEPLLSALAASLLGVLSGNAALLKEHYRLVIEGTEGAWTLEMTPVDAEVSRYVERIVVSGRAERIGIIEVREASGDRSELTVTGE